MSKTITPTMLPFARWTDDCSGKKDFDGPIISVFTRYWPAGGSGMVYDTAHPELGLHPENNGAPASAHSEIVLRYYTAEGYANPEDDQGEYETLVEKEFKGGSGAEVRAQVVAWVHQQLIQIHLVLLSHYHPEVKGGY
jgi:hypothetical protein